MDLPDGDSNPVVPCGEVNNFDILPFLVGGGDDGSREGREIPKGKKRVNSFFCEVEGRVVRAGEALKISPCQVF